MPEKGKRIKISSCADPVKGTRIALVSCEDTVKGQRIILAECKDVPPPPEFECHACEANGQAVPTGWDVIVSGLSPCSPNSRLELDWAIIDGTPNGVYSLTNPTFTQFRDDDDPDNDYCYWEGETNKVGYTYRAQDTRLVEGQRCREPYGEIYEFHPEAGYVEVTVYRSGRVVIRVEMALPAWDRFDPVTNEYGLTGDCEGMSGYKCIEKCTGCGPKDCGAYYDHWMKTTNISISAIPRYD